jgi:hypothetical protein
MLLNASEDTPFQKRTQASRLRAVTAKGAKLIERKNLGRRTKGIFG